MNRNTLFSTGILTVAVLFTVYIWTENEKITLHAEVKKAKALQEWVSTQTRTVAIPIHRDAVLKDSMGTEVPLRELTLRGGFLALYIDMHQCSACWKKELDHLRTVYAQLDSTQTPIVILGDMLTHDMKIWKRTNEPKFPVYTLKTSDYPELSTLISLDAPFYFTVNRNGILGNVLVGTPESRPWQERYIARLRQEIRQDKPEGNPIAANSLIEITPRLIELGEIRVRQKVGLSFRVKNTSDTSVLLSDIDGSCECLDVDTASVWLKPQAEHTIRAALLMTDVGDFMREITFRTSHTTAPHYVTIIGNVK